MRKPKSQTLRIIGFIIAAIVLFWVLVMVISWMSYSRITGGVTKGTSTPEIDSIMGTYQLTSTDATEENPITPSHINADREDTLTATIGYFNRNDFTVIDARPQILECNDSQGNTFDSPVWFYASRANIPAGKKIGFEASVYADDDATPGEYTCTIIIFNNYNYGTYDLYENINWLTDARTPENPVYEIGKIDVTIE